MRNIILFLLLVDSSLGLAQMAVVPKEKVPEVLLNQLRLIEADFVVALQKDCGGTTCYPRGCVYVSHEMVSLQGNRTLPGLSQEGETRVSGEPQYVLTGLSCEYAYEKGFDKQELQNLNRRLESKLSKGALRVSLKAIEIPLHSKETLLPNAELTILDKLGLKLLDHFSWILGVLLAILTVIFGLWAWRRIGRDTKEDELRFMLYKQKLEADAAAPPPEPTPNVEDPEAAALKERLTQLHARHDQNPSLLQVRLQLWMEEEKFPKVACSLLLLAEAQQSPLGEGAKSSLLSLRLGAFMQNYTPTHEERRSVLKELEQEQSLHAHFDQTHVLRVRQLFSRYDAANLLARGSGLEARRALFALAPALKIKELVAALALDDVLPLAQSFWLSSRVRSVAVGDWLGEKADGDALSTQESDATWILGFLFSRLNPEQRSRIQALGSRPWTERMFYPESLAELPLEKAQDLLLSVDGVALNHWYAFLNREQQTMILPLLPASYRAQIHGFGNHSIDVLQVMATIRTYGHQMAEILRRGA